MAPEELNISRGVEVPLAEAIVRARYEDVGAVRAELEIRYHRFVRCHQLAQNRSVVGVPQV